MGNPPPVQSGKFGPPKKTAPEREVDFLRELVRTQNAMIERLLAERLQPQFIPMPNPVPTPCPCPPVSPYPDILPSPMWPQSPIIPIFPNYPEVICDAVDPLARARSAVADFYATHDVRWKNDLHGTMQ